MATRVEVSLLIDGAWVDVTEDVSVEQGITISAGRRNEGGRAEPAECRLSFLNSDGKYTPRNPESPYYGLIGRNTPLRVITRHTIPVLAGSATTSCPDSAALSFTGDIDVRMDVAMQDWTGNLAMCQKWVEAGNQRTWQLYTNSNGFPVFRWSADGTNVLTAVGTAPVPVTCGRQALRATLDVDNGAAGNTTTFYTAPTAAGPWTQHGAPVIKAGTTSLYNSTSAVQVIAESGWQAYSAQVYEGIGGALRASPDYTAQTAGATSFNDAQGNTWTVPAGSITDGYSRFWGEVSGWPQTWGPKTPVWAQVTANGLLRRYGQGNQPEFSALRYGVPVLDALVGYWPLEDAEGSTLIASGLADNNPGQVYSTGTLTFEDAEPFVSSKPLPTIGTGSMTFTVPAGRNGVTSLNNQGMCRFLISIPSGGSVDGAVVARIYYTSGASVDLIYSTASGGTLVATAYSPARAFVISSNQLFPMNGLSFLMSVETNTATSEFGLAMITPGGTVALATTPVACTFGNRVVSVNINPGAANLTDVAIGHLHIQDVVETIYNLGVIPRNALDGYVSEPAAVRAQRICGALGVTFVALGGVEASEPMGAQTVGTLLSNLADCETVDLGYVSEPRGESGFRYRTRASLTNQHPTLTIAYSDLAGLEPDPDDLRVVNDILATRVGGTSYRAEQTIGPMSVNDPPDGVGRYTNEFPINAAADTAMPDHAGWRLHAGTVDAPRFPAVTVDITDLTDVQARGAIGAVLGHMIRITDLPEWVGPDDLDLIIIGYTEEISSHRYLITYRCIPADPFDVGRYDYDHRYDSLTTELDEDLDTTETGVTVQITSGPVWTQDAGHVPFDIIVGGERMTVTAVSGATSPQTFTVTRSVNGVVKTHQTGSQVRLFVPYYYGL